MSELDSGHKFAQRELSRKMPSERARWLAFGGAPRDFGIGSSRSTEPRSRTLAMPQSYSVPPTSDEHAELYARYVALVPAGDIIATLDRQRDEMLTLLGPIPESRAGFRYAPGKWSIREVVGHIADAERVFAYRMLRIGRGDQTPLAAFDENAYTPPSGYDSRHLREIAAELAAVRDGTVALLKGLPMGVMENKGTASGHAVSVRALAWIAAGHELHHQKLLRERYLA